MQHSFSQFPDATRYMQLLVSWLQNHSVTRETVPYVQQSPRLQKQTIIPLQPETLRAHYNKLCTHVKGTPLVMASTWCSHSLVPRLLPAFRCLQYYTASDRKLGGGLGTRLVQPGNEASAVTHRQQAAASSHQAGLSQHLLDQFSRKWSSDRKTEGSCER